MSCAPVFTNNTQIIENQCMKNEDLMLYSTSKTIKLQLTFLSHAIVKKFKARKRKKTWYTTGMKPLTSIWFS